MLQKPGLITGHNIMELDTSFAFKQLKWLSREFDSFLPKFVGQYVRNPTEEIVFEVNVFD
jgi:hypothetical protein